MTSTNTRGNKAPSLTLQVGKRYVQRDGTVTGGLVENGNSYYPFRCHVLERNWEADGTWMRGARNQRDIVAEYQEPQTQEKPKEEHTMSNIQLEVGKFYRTARGDKVFCAVELVGQEFAVLYDFVEEEDKFNYVERYCSNGEAVLSDDRDDNIISEWIDPPKTKKVLMYQVLYKSQGCSKYCIAKQLYENEAKAIKNLGSSFIRLLTDRPVEVEMPV